MKESPIEAPMPLNDHSPEARRRKALRGRGAKLQEQFDRNLGPERNELLDGIRRRRNPRL